MTGAWMICLALSSTGTWTTMSLILSSTLNHRQLPAMRPTKAQYLMLPHPTEEVQSRGQNCKTSWSAHQQECHCSKDQPFKEERNTSVAWSRELVLWQQKIVFSNRKTAISTREWTSWRMKLGTWELCWPMRACWLSCCLDWAVWTAWNFLPRFSRNPTRTTTIMPCRGRGWRWKTKILQVASACMWTKTTSRWNSAPSVQRVQACHINVGSSILPFQRFLRLNICTRCKWGDMTTVVNSLNVCRAWMACLLNLLSIQVTAKPVDSFLLGAWSAMLDDWVTEHPWLLKSMVRIRK